MLEGGLSILAAVVGESSRAAFLKVEVAADSCRSLLEIRVVHRDFTHFVLALPSVSSITIRAPSVVPSATTSIPSAPISTSPVTATLVKIPSLPSAVHRGIEAIHAEEIPPGWWHSGVAPAGESVHRDVICHLDVRWDVGVAVVGVVRQGPVEEAVEHSKRILSSSSEELVLGGDLKNKTLFQ